MLSPVATNATIRAAFSTGRVNVILSGGGFGESVIAATIFSFSYQSENKKNMKKGKKTPNPTKHGSNPGSDQHRGKRQLRRATESPRPFRISARAPSSFFVAPPPKRGEIQKETSRGITRPQKLSPPPPPLSNYATGVTALPGRGGKYRWRRSSPGAGGDRGRGSRCARPVRPPAAISRRRERPHRGKPRESTGMGTGARAGYTLLPGPGVGT